MSDEPSTFAGAVRRYYEKYPEAGAAAAAEEACKQLHTPCDETKKSYARVLKSRWKAAVTARKFDRSAARGGVVADGVIAVHRVTGGPVEVPPWLAAGIVEAAVHPEEVLSHGWLRPGGKSKNGMLHCLIPGTPFRMVFYPSTGRLTAYAGDGELDMEKKWELRTAVIGNLSSVVQPVVSASSDPPNLAQNLRMIHRELEKFVDGVLLAEDSRGYHMTWHREDFKNIGPFKMTWKDRRITFRKDGSHPNCLEVEVSPTGTADMRQQLQAQTTVLSEFTKQISLHLSVMQQIGANTKAQTQATEGLKNAVDELNGLLAASSRSAPAASQTGRLIRQPADDKRRYA